MLNASKNRYIFKKTKIIEKYGKPEYELNLPVNESAKRITALQKVFARLRWRKAKPKLGSPDRRIKLATWSEQAAITRFKKAGYSVFRNGWPDLLLMKDGKARFIELKGPSDKLSTKQIEMHKQLKTAGILVETRYYEEV